MALTIADLVAETSFELNCVTGHEHLSRPISVVHVSEIGDPAPWLRQDVFLLTTGLIKRTQPELEDFFINLRDAGVSGLGFGVGVDDDDVPNEWLECANKHEIPIISVPLTTPYIAISEFVRNRHTDAQFAQVERMITAQQRLAHSKLTQSIQRDTLEALAVELRATVYWPRPKGFNRTVHGDIPLSSHQETILSREVTHHLSTHQASTTTALDNLYVHIARTAGVPIAVVRPERYTPLEQGIIGTVATFLDLTHTEDADAEPTGVTRGSVVREQIFSKLLRGQIQNIDDVLPLLLEGSYSCVAVSLAPLLNDIRMRSDSSELEDQMRAFFARDSRVSSVGYSSVVGSVERGIGIALGVDNIETADAIMHRFFTLFDRQYSGWTAGISTHGNTTDVVQLYSEAEYARQSASPDGTNAKVRTFDSASKKDDYFHHDLFDIEVPVYEAWRAQVQRLQKKRAQQILRATYEFLACNGVTETAAAKIGVHRQTIQARIREAESTFSVSLDSPSDRALLWIAYINGVFKLE